jgi:hypothetical protein
MAGQASEQRLQGNRGYQSLTGDRRLTLAPVESHAPATRGSVWFHPSHPAAEPNRRPAGLARLGRYALGQNANTERGIEKLRKQGRRRRRLAQQAA